MQIEKCKQSRQGVVVREIYSDALYLFGVPVYCTGTNRPVKMQFEKKQDGSYVLQGTNCIVKITSESILFRSSKESICVRFPEVHQWVLANGALFSDSIKLSPTTNGLAVNKKISGAKGFDIYVSTGRCQTDIKSNSKYFAVMKRKFVPTFTVSAIGILNDEKNLCALRMKNAYEEEKLRYKVSFDNANLLNGEMLFEINMYEPKLIQDTTVEFLHRSENNAYGSVAYIGKSNDFGEQRLYLKFDYLKFEMLKGKRISSIKLYLPVICGRNVTFEAFAMEKRFCSFGSSWKNKIDHGNKKLTVSADEDFCCIDLSDIMTDNHKKLKMSFGVLLKAVKETEDYSVISTGDSYRDMPILEVRYEA